MKLIRCNESNVTASDDSKLFNCIFFDGLFKDVSISLLGSNQVSIGDIYGILKGRDFVIKGKTINVPLASSGSQQGTIYIKIDLNSEDKISIQSKIGTFNPVKEDINETGNVYEYALAKYNANSLAVNSIEKEYCLSSGDKLIKKNIAITPTANAGLHSDKFPFSSKVKMNGISSNDYADIILAPSNFDVPELEATDTEKDNVILYFKEMPENNPLTIAAIIVSKGV